MKLFFQLLVTVFLVMSAWGPFAVLMAEDCGKDLPSVVAPQDLASVLFVVSGNLAQANVKGLDVQAIKKDIHRALNKAGIQPEITEKKEAITTDRFLKVHIYSILLERQVYFCSVAIIQRRSSQEEGCTVIDHSTVTSQARNIRSQIQELMDSILQDVR